MQKFKMKFIALTIIIVSLTSFTVVSKKSTTVPADKVAAVNKAIDAAKADGKISYGELKNIATIAKGEKLSLKEKIALKVFGKKIGNKLIAATGNGGDGGKSQLIALILCFFLGGIGVHRFYLGYTWQGIVQLLTLGGCGIWSLIDFIRIITGDLKPKDGDYDTTL